MPSSSIKKTSWAWALAVAVALMAASSEAFTMPTTTSSNNYLMSRTSIPKTPFSNAAFLTQSPSQSPSQSLSKSSQLQMGFNLPPSPTPPDPKADIQSILKTTGLIGAIVLFFISPLGGIFFALTNSLLLLLILTPFLASIGFTIWQSLYTIEAPCPSCGVPARVLKDDEAGPNICLSCGQMIRATVDKDGIELCNDPNDVFDEGSRISSLFDLFTGGNGVGEAGSFMGSSGSNGSGGIGDGDPSVFFGDNRGSNNGNNDAEDQKNKKKRESTVIDVDVTPE